MEVPSKWRIDWADVRLARPRSIEPAGVPKPEERVEPERRRGRVSRATATVIAGLVIVAVVAGAVLITRTHGERASVKRLSRSSAAKLGALHPANSAFVAAGVRFTVVPNPNQAWTRETKAATPGSGFRWQTVAVLYRNLSRRHVSAEQLRFRLEDARGRVYLPDPQVGNAGSELPPSDEIPVGRLVHGQLAFRVRTDAEKLLLVMNPSPRTRARVAVPPD